MAKFSKRLLGIFVAICMLTSLFTCMIGINVSAEGTSPDLVEFLGADWTCMKYTKGWSTIQAGDYRFEMDCKITSGVPCIQVGRDETGAALKNDSEEVIQTNYTETYDSVNYKYVITFTLTEDFKGNLGAMVGNYGEGNRNNTTGDAVFACANPTLYLLDGEGNPTGESLINTFAEDYYSTSRTGNKWNRRNFGSKTATCTNPIPEDYFAPYVEPIHEYVHFEPTRNNYSRFLYSVGYKTIPAGDYRFQMDCKIFSGTPRIAVGDRDGGNTVPQFGDELQTNYNASYDAENYKYTITFTLPSGLTGANCIGILVGNYGDDGDFVCAEPTLYQLDGSGEPTGDNLVKPFASDFYSSDTKSGYWRRAGNYTCDELPEHYFDLESTNTYMAHFPAGGDNYQMLAYKDTGIYTTPGTYRLIADVSVKGEVEPSVMMRTGTDIGNTVTSNGVVSTVGNTRVYEFTVDTAARGIGVMLGNYGEGETLDVTFGKIGLYKYADGVYQGANILAPFNADTYDRGDWSYSRATANNARWTPINCDSDLIKVGEYDAAAFCAHDGETETVEAVASTCCTQGHGEYVICKICGATVSGDDSPLDLDPNNHEGETEVRDAVEATCSAHGYTGDTYCLGCGEKIADGEETDFAEHTVGEWLNDATYHWHYCSVCEGVLDQVEHTYEWVVTKEATAEENGLREEVCSVCGYKSGNSEEIIFSAHIPGDVNGDGALNNKDLTRLFQYLSDWDVTVNEAALDINGDGSVNNKDLTRLFQFLSDWDVEIF